MLGVTRANLRMGFLEDLCTRIPYYHRTKHRGILWSFRLLIIVIAITITSSIIVIIMFPSNITLVVVIIGIITIVIVILVITIGTSHYQYQQHHPTAGHRHCHCLCSALTLFLLIIVNHHHHHCHCYHQHHQGNTPLKINVEHNHGGLVQIFSFLFTGDGCRFQPLIFQDVSFIFGKTRPVLPRRPNSGCSLIDGSACISSSVTTASRVACLSDV